jgi:hypothetical protein
MTEQEWIESNDPSKLLDFLHEKTIERKLRLVGCAAKRKLIPAAPMSVAIAESLADGLIAIEQVPPEVSTTRICQPDAWWAAFYHAGSDFLNEGHNSSCTAIIRDIFGNPFKPVTFNPSWLTPIVKALATTIYEQRAFDRMPVLADALEESGCSVQEVLEHCRNGQEHVRGCFVLDKVLGTE